MNMIMKMSIVFLILLVLLSGIFFYLLMRQNHNQQKLESEYESLQERLAVLEIQPQTGEDVEKMELAAKLINSEFGKFERELRNSNDKWLWGWTGFFATIVAIVVTVTGVAFWVVVKSMIADRVEERLNGFKESVDKVSILEGQIKILEKEHAIFLLEDVNIPMLIELERYPRQTKALREEVLLEVFSDKTCGLGIRWTAVNVLGARKSPRLVSPVLNYLNSVVDSDLEWGTSHEPDHYPYLFLSRLSDIHNEEAYQGIKNFLNRLLTENPRHKDLFLSWTVFSLAQVSIELKIKDSVGMLKKVIPNLIELKPDEVVLITLAEYFDKFEEQEGIRQILEHPEADKMPDVKTKCLELLEKYNSNNTEREESDESKPTT